MRIAVLGAGAMGSLVGGYLSQHNEVWLIDVDQEKVDAIASKGILIEEAEGSRTFHPRAVSSSDGLAEMDLVIVFVKAMYSRVALESNRNLIGENTCVMSMQNGAGHEEVLLQFAPAQRVILGTTQHNSSVIESGRIHHGGGGKTYISGVGCGSNREQSIADMMTACGIETEVTDCVKSQIWSKLFVNTTASVLTGVLQVRLGYILENRHAWTLAKALLSEAVAVANADGMEFDLEEVIGSLRTLLEGARDGYTSIYADLRDGVVSEVDTISGWVARAAKRLGVDAPHHEFIVGLVHALEQREE